MTKQTGAKAGGWLPAVVCGGMGAALFLILLFLAAVFGARRPELISSGAWTAKACLACGALLCGWIAGGRAGERKLLHALAAEGTLLAVMLLISIGCGNALHLPSLFVDLAFLLFGAFAGTIRRGKGKIKRRGKR